MQPLPLNKISPLNIKVKYCRSENLGLLVCNIIDVVTIIVHHFLLKKNLDVVSADIQPAVHHLNIQLLVEYIFKHSVEINIQPAVFNTIGITQLLKSFNLQKR